MDADTYEAIIGRTRVALLAYRPGPNLTEGAWLVTGPCIRQTSEHGLLEDAQETAVTDIRDWFDGLERQPNDAAEARPERASQRTK